MQRLQQENQILFAKAAMLEKLVSSGDHTVALLEQQTQGLSVSSAEEDCKSDATPAELRSVFKQYKAYVSSVGILIVHIQKMGVDPVVLQQVADLMQLTLDLIHSFAVRNRVQAQLLNCCNLDTGRVGERPRSEHWQPVVRMLRDR